MKRIIIILIILFIFFLASSKSDTVVIPKQAIRYRVIANSNSNYDQKEKKHIAKILGQDVKATLNNSNNLNDARKALKNNVSKFQDKAQEIAKKDNYSEEVKINYGNNYFPEKVYKGVTYNEGEYESLVVTLGKGSGNNFWCVLFPPLCLLEGEEEKTDTVHYTSFVKELLDKYF